jgi:hypothetical protein
MMRAWLLATMLLAAVAAASAQQPPPLVFEASPAMAALAERLRSFDRGRLAVAMRLAGLERSDDPVLLLLADESSELARRAPPWVSGYADGARGIAVILPGRIPNYPDRSLEAVVQHEATHVFVARAARGRPVPRWFDEGVAMAAARVWTFEDRTQLAWGMLTGGLETLEELEAAFGRSAPRARAAYALSSALVRDLQRQVGPEVTAGILRRVGEGAAFEAAFEAAAGQSLATFARAFFRRQTFWNRWVPWLTSSAALWLAITFLALAAFRRRRRRDAEIARRWEVEDHARRAVPRRPEEPPPEEMVN